jgi:hypothetical protein
VMRTFEHAVLAISLTLAGCSAPRVASAPESSATAAVPVTEATPPTSAEASPAIVSAPESASPAPTAGGLPVAPATAPSATPVEPAPAASLHDAEGKPLPQTEERPSTTSPAFLRRMELLVRAIEADDAKLAHEAFFPVVAYEQVKDIEKPALDHERRLLAAFARNVHEYHRQLGKDVSGLRFVRVEVPEDKVKWMKVRSEGNRVGYHRVLRSRLVVATASDKERSFEITSMISWRGEWYVVHLHGFK